jgi:hypothetical protein
LRPIWTNTRSPAVISSGTHLRTGSHRSSPPGAALITANSAVSGNFWAEKRHVARRAFEQDSPTPYKAVHAFRRQY